VVEPEVGPLAADIERQALEEPLEKRRQQFVGTPSRERGRRAKGLELAQRDDDGDTVRRHRGARSLRCARSSGHGFFSGQWASTIPGLNAWTASTISRRSASVAK